jgi:gamma-glutamylputrescine oxidase
MDTLFRNDQRGAFPESWYAATTDLPAPRPPLDGDTRTDVCIIGAGYTGLCAALALAQKGYKPLVLDAHRAGFGASGRNGGQVGSGFNKDQAWLEARVGDNLAHAMWDMAQDAKAQVRRYTAAHAPEARYRPGVAEGAYTPTEADDLKREADHLADAYGYTEMDPLDPDGMHALVRTKRYAGGYIDWGAGHIHPLRYAVGLARAAEAAGARICEMTEATGLTQGRPAQIETPQGTVTADHVILAGNGYMPDLDPKLAARVMPINSFIAATEPLSDPKLVLGQDIAVADSKFVVNYYRMSEDNRLLFGGRESYTLGFPQDIKTALVARMTSLFPQLEGVGVGYVWGGTLGITLARLPMVARLGPNVLTASGFSGHGVALSGFAGTVMAEAIAGQAERFDILSQLPVQPFPGGATFRAPLLTLAMTWYALRDRLGV